MHFTLSYRLEFKSWIAKGDKVKLENKKRNVQHAFKNENRLLIDTVKQGHGTTNDGFLQMSPQLLSLL